jgi:hypothetical protein
MTAGMNFHEPDHLDAQYYNNLLEYGILGRGTPPSGHPKTVAAADSDD